jgi:hypothetical protein
MLPTPPKSPGKESPGEYQSNIFGTACTPHARISKFLPPCPLAKIMGKKYPRLDKNAANSIKFEITETHSPGASSPLPLQSITLRWWEELKSKNKAFQQ